MISVVIPAFNEETLLPRCLTSIKNQTYTGSFEIVVSNNASTDATAQVATTLGARVVHCPLRGVAHARQVGAEAAEGDIIVQADADTVYPPYWLARIATYFENHPHSVAVSGGYYYEDPPRWARFEYITRYFVNMVSLLLLGRPVIISGANFAFRRNTFLRTDGYEPNTLYPDQWGISHSLSRHGKVAFDRALLVATSARRVQRPAHTLLKDTALNLARIIRHFCKYVADSKRPIVKQHRLKIKRAVSIFLLAITWPSRLI